MERIFAGINLDFQGKSEQYIYSSLSTTNNFKMNGFANLSINLKYCLSTSTSIFIEGGNLLNQRVQHCPFYADLGINISAGIALKF